MHDERRPQRALTYSLAVAVLLTPLGVSLATAFSCTRPINPLLFDRSTALLSALLWSVPLPSAILCAVLAPLAALPQLSMPRRTPRGIARMLAILLSLLLLPLAALAPLYAHMQAAGRCLAYLGLLAFFGPEPWVFCVSAASTVLSALFSFQTLRELSAA